MKQARKREQPSFARDVVSNDAWNDVVQAKTMEWRKRFAVRSNPGGAERESVGRFSLVFEEVALPTEIVHRSVEPLAANHPARDEIAIDEA